MDESRQLYLDKPVNETADVLRRAKQLLATPDKWCKGALEDSHGRMCIMGAIYKAANGDAFRESSKSARAQWVMGDAVGGLRAAWNNAPERTHAEVLAAFDRAIALAEQQGL